jgi:hypothetical protein
MLDAWVIINESTPNLREDSRGAQVSYGRGEEGETRVASMHSIVE